MKRLLLLCLLPLSLFASQPQTVVCIHGFLGDSWNWAFYQKHLLRDGYRVLSIDYSSTKKSISDHGKDLAKELVEIAKINPNEPINFVAHSMGSLVLRSALNEPLCPKEAKIGRIVLLAPPNQGSFFARKTKPLPIFKQILSTTSGHELSSYENFEHLGKFPHTAEVLIVAGTFGFDPWNHQETDGKVNIAETRLSTPHEFQKVGCGHTSILLSKKALRKTRKFLSKNPKQPIRSNALPPSHRRPIIPQSQPNMYKKRILK